ncbi:hypothetical protein NW754_003860 [Fusarium falciforme]|nr:hypothetical protein NW754_003860 [Fusarium falciforme]
MSNQPVGSVTPADAAPVASSSGNEPIRSDSSNGGDSSMGQDTFVALSSGYYHISDIVSQFEQYCFCLFQHP